MIVKVCDECRKFIDTENPCSIVALRDDKKQTIAFRKVVESGPLGKVSGHFCNNACAALFFEKWLEGVLPPMPEIEVPDSEHDFQFGHSGGEGVCRRCHCLWSDIQLGKNIPCVPSTVKPHVVDLREPTPQEQADQNSVLLSVLGSG